MVSMMLNLDYNCHVLRRLKRRTTGSKVNTNKPTQKRAPRLVTVQKVQRVSPHMTRLTLWSPEFGDVRPGCEGANCKLLLPDRGETMWAFHERLINGPRPITRTYTVRHFRADRREMDIDFVMHDDPGPASRFAATAQPGNFCGIAGPGPNKHKTFHADWYLLAADMSALPVAAATLEAMPRDSRGFAVFEVTSEEDRLRINAPPGIRIEWRVHADPHIASSAQEAFIRSLPWQNGTLQTCIAGESGVIRSLRKFLHEDKLVPRQDTYISGYWKIGMREDEHQAMKRAEADAEKIAP